MASLTLSAGAVLEGSGTSLLGADDSLAVMHALPTGLLVVEPDSSVSFANARASEVLGRGIDEICGQPVDRVFVPLSSLKDGTDSSAELRLDTTIRRPDQTEVLVGFNVAKLPSGRVAVVLQDISRWQSLRVERDRLLRLAAVGELLPTMLHELKNPLAGITATVEVLLEEVLPGPVQDQLHAVLSEVRRMKLGFDGVGFGDRQLQARDSGAIDLACREAFRVLAARAQSAGLVARCDVADMPLLPLDPAAIRAMVFNLVVNAIHACSRGDTVRLSARLRSEGGELELSVSDTGSGMSREVYERCTELFFSTKRSGSGIGLALCHRAVNEAGGTFEIRSVPGVGTNVSARIPVHRRRRFR